jgi:hypothetical protein
MNLKIVQEAVFYPGNCSKSRPWHTNLFPASNGSGHWTKSTSDKKRELKRVSVEFQNNIFKNFWKIHFEKPKFHTVTSQQ